MTVPVVFCLQLNYYLEFHPLTSLSIRSSNDFVYTKWRATFLTTEATKFLHRVHRGNSVPFVFPPPWTLWFIYS